MLFRRNTGSPSILRGYVLIQRPSLTWCPIKVFPISSTRHSVVIPKETPFPQLWEEKFNYILERLREKRVSL